MSDCLDYNIRQYYGNARYLRLLSWSGEPIVNSPEGMRNELAKLSVKSATPLKRAFRMLSDIKYLEQKTMFFKSVQFLVYDTYGREVDVPNGQDSDMFDEVVTNSQNSTPQKMSNHSNFINGMLPINHLDNHFRPKLIVNDYNICNDIVGNKDNSFANESIGIPHNFCWDLSIHCEEFKSISGETAFAQFIKEQSAYQNYPVLAIVEVWLNDKVTI